MGKSFNLKTAQRQPMIVSKDAWVGSTRNLHQCIVCNTAFAPRTRMRCITLDRGFDRNRRDRYLGLYFCGACSSNTNVERILAQRNVRYNPPLDAEYYHSSRPSDVPSQTNPSQAKPSQTDPSQTDPSQTTKELNSAEFAEIYFKELNQWKPGQGRRF
jgi:hypothetical protein